MERLSNSIKTAQQSYIPAKQRAPQYPPAQGQRSAAPLYSMQEQQHTRSTSVSRAPEYSYYTQSAPLPRQPKLPEDRWELTTPPRAPFHMGNNSGGQRAIARAHFTEPLSPAPHADEPAQGNYYEEEGCLTVIPIDTQEDWDDDTAPIRYGDWEDESNIPATDHYTSRAGFTSRPPVQDISLAAQRLAQVYYRSDPSVAHEVTHTTPNTMHAAPARDAYLSAPRQARAATTHETRLPMPAPKTQLTARQTQPLKPQYTKHIARQVREARLQPPALPHTPREASVDYRITVNSAPPPKPNVCPICQGAGFLRSNVAFGHPQFGKPVACQCKEQERKRKRRQQLQELSNLGAFADKRFDTFNRLPNLQEAYQVSATFAKDPNGWLLFIGPNGCGKTHLAAAIANSCLDAGAVVLFSTVPDLLDHLRAAFAPESEEVYDQLFARMREAEVLILDDLGTQQSSPWANEKLFQLLNYRYNSGFPTVITANPKGFQATDERIRSRLGDASLVTSLNLDHARDYRPRNPRRPEH